MKKALIKLHLAVLLAGATGLFGKLLTLKEIPLVWYRLLFTTIMLLPILLIGRKLARIPAKAILSIASAGMLLGLHWVLFYASIRVSNVSIGVLCYALIGFYTAVLDPFINHHSFDWRNIVFSAITLVGLFLIYSFDTRYRLGIAIGALSSLVAAFFSMTTKKLTGKYDYPSSTFVMYEMAGGLVFLSAALPFFMAANTDTSLIPCLKDLVFLLVLAGVCTIGQYLLQFDALKQISTFTVNLTYNLEPVYSILFAMLLFGEARDLDASFYLGLVLIISSVILQNFTSSKKL